MREWALEVHTKDGELVDWRKMDWTKTDIREYDVVQPNGPKSVMGKVKFSFPNQHTVFMHDTLPRDKYMFNAVQRTFSHGCMRVHNPTRLAEILLREDQGWDTARVAEAFSTGPLNAHRQRARPLGAAAGCAHVLLIALHRVRADGNDRGRLQLGVCGAIAEFRNARRTSLSSGGSQLPAQGRMDCVSVATH